MCFAFSALTLLVGHQEGHPASAGPYANHLHLAPDR